MNELERLLIERSCERLMVEYCHLVDHGDAGAIGDLFTADGVWEAPGTRMEGRAEVRAGMAGRQARTHRRSRHVCNNMLVRVIDADTAAPTVSARAR